MKIATVDFKDPKAPQEFVRSLKETGFAVIKNHNVPADLFKTVHQEWEAFFASEDKKKYLFNPKDQTGFFPFKSENAKDSPIKDLKEFYHLYSSGHIPKEMSQKTWELRDQLNNVGSVLLEWIQDNLPEDVRSKLLEPLPNQIKGSDHTLFRFLHYPPLPKTAEEGAVRAAAHEDINLITILSTAVGPGGESSIGAKTGLEVKDIHGNWYEVESDPNSLIINCGDMLQLATGGYLISTTHQVKNPSGEGSKLPRYSCPLFIHPRPDVLLAPNKTAGQYLEERLKEIGLKK